MIDLDEWRAAVHDMTEADWDDDQQRRARGICGEPEDDR